MKHEDILFGIPAAPTYTFNDVQPPRIPLYVVDQTVLKMTATLQAQGASQDEIMFNIELFLAQVGWTLDQFNAGDCSRIEPEKKNVVLN